MVFIVSYRYFIFNTFNSFIILIQIMIRKVVLNQLLTNYSLFKSKYFLLSSIKNVTRKSQFYYSSQCSHKFCYKFSNLSKKELEKKAIDEANIIYNKYKWTD